MTANRGIILLTVLWFLVLAGLVLLATERTASEASALLWQTRETPRKAAQRQSLRLFIPALLAGQTLPPATPRWTHSTATAFAKAGHLGRGVITIHMGSHSLTVIIQDTAGLLAPGWQPALLPVLAQTLAKRRGDPAALRRWLYAYYFSGYADRGPALPATVAWQLAALTTRHPVYGGQININSVPAPVLRVLGVSIRRIRAFIRHRAQRTTPYTSRDLGRVTQRLGFGEGSLLGTRLSGVYRLTIQQEGRNQHSALVQTLTIRTDLAASAVPQRRPGA